MTISAQNTTVLYTSPIGGDPYPVAECTTEQGATAIARWANLSECCQGRGFTGIADELDALAEFTGDLVEFVSSLDPQSPARLKITAMLRKLNERGAFRTWCASDTPNMAEYLKPEPRHARGD